MKLLQECKNDQAWTRPDHDVVHVMRELAFDGRQEAFMVFNEAKFDENVTKWKNCLPEITPFFDVALNSLPIALHVLEKQGFHFTCRNREELKLVQSLGIDGKKILFKSGNNFPIVTSHLRVAAGAKVGFVAATTIQDLHKIKKTYPDVGVFIALDVGSCDEFSITNCFNTAKDLGLTVRGVCFQEPLGEEINADYSKMLAFAKMALTFGKVIGYDSLDMVDLGTPHRYHDGMKKAKEAIKTTFNSNDWNVCATANDIMESTMSIVAMVCGKRESREDGTRTYVLNDGVYGMFGHCLGDPCKVSVIEETALRSHDPIKSELWGPTGDDFDCENQHAMIPDAFEGDWLAFENLATFGLAVSSSGAANTTKYPNSDCWIITRSRDVEEHDECRMYLNFPCDAMSSTFTDGHILDVVLARDPKQA